MAMPIMKIVGKGMLRLHAAIPLQSMVMGVIIFVTALVWLSTGFVGIGVLIVGTILGLMPPRIGIRRSHGMGNHPRSHHDLRSHRWQIVSVLSEIMKDSPHQKI